MEVIVVNVAASLISFEGLPESGRRLAHEAQKEFVDHDVRDCHEYEYFYGSLEFFVRWTEEPPVEQENGYPYSAHHQGIQETTGQSALIRRW